MISFIVTAALAATGQHVPAELPAVSATSAAMAWASLIDQQRWDESWAAAGSLFRSQATQAGWAATVKSVREPLGPIVSRRFLGTTKASSLPGAPDGEYEIAQFQTIFTHKREAVETIVLTREPSGWKVAGYFVR